MTIPTALKSEPEGSRSERAPLDREPSGSLEAYPRATPCLAMGWLGSIDRAR
jgi:hypothetical protein